MKVLLICPPSRVDRGTRRIMSSPPLNLLYLTSSVSDHDVDLLNLNVESYNADMLRKKLKHYDLVGITCMTSTFGIVLRICRVIKNLGISNILGGYHPTLMPNIIDEHDCIDMICRGEGEVLFKELLDGKEKSEILGLSYRDADGVHHNPDRPFLKNLDDLPFPDNNILDSTPYKYLWTPTWVVETSRGCPFGCDFCCVHQFHKRTYRTKSPERVIKEVENVPENVKTIFFIDDNFTANKKRVKKICELLQKTHLNKKYMFACQSRVDDIANNPDMIKEMHKAGFIIFFIGFETFKQMSLDHMQKQITIEKSYRAIKICHKNGIVIMGSFIVGNIDETKEDILSTFKKIKCLEIDLLSLSGINPYPKTKLHQEAVKNGWIDKDFKWEKWDLSIIMHTPDLTIDEINHLMNYGNKMFYNSKRLLYYGKLIIKFMINPKYRWSYSLITNFLKNGFVEFMPTVNARD